MGISGINTGAWVSGRAWRFCAVAAALSLFGCDDAGPLPEVVTPVGRLVQAALRGPVSYTTQQNWRIAIQDGAITVRPPETGSDPALRYTSQGMREHLGAFDLRAWTGDRRSILLPGGAKMTLHGQAGQLLRVSIYEGEESHEVDVLTQTVMHSRIDPAVARSRDTAEHDGETGHLVIVTRSLGTNSAVPTLYLANLYVQNSGMNGVPLREEPSPLALGEQVAENAYGFPTVVPALPPETEAPCDGPPQERGGLTRHVNGTLEYVSRSGLWAVKVDQHTITMTRNMGPSVSSRWEVWGDPHENLNGKHIKDWETTRRTFVLDDGTRITMDAEGPQGVVHTTSIYDGAQSHEIGNAGNLLRHSCVHSQTARQRDAAQVDGETAYLVVLRGPDSPAGSLSAENIYTETAETGGEPVRTFDPTLLGVTGDVELNPGQVRDFYDDPRLGHT
jgi:hypothetical protein